MTAPAGGVAGEPNPALLKEAADWIMTLRYDGATEQDRQSFDRWRQQSPAHADAWARAEAVLGTFDQLPAGIGRDALQGLQQVSRRRSLQLLGMLLAVAPAGWLGWRQLPWREWTADVATATGERRSMVLADGSRLVLNTDSAVDIVFTAGERNLRLLAGEILVTTHDDPSPIPRPFLVHTPHGVVRALGTRFGVRCLGQGEQAVSRVSVFEHAVEIRPLAGPASILAAGQQVDFSAGSVQAPVSADHNAALWEQGMLLAKNMRLADVLAEMGRYRRGVLRCHPAVADLRVSGAISLSDTDAGLALLAGSMPLRIEQVTRFWVTVMPA